jgi:hypothetical protein
MPSKYLRRLDAQGHLKVKEALRQWDPIGVLGSDPTWPDDEYDAYAGPVVHYLDAGAKKEALIKYLEEVCTERIGVPFDRPLTEKIIDELLVFWPLWKKEMQDLGPDASASED